ncbi:MAG: discoidin domain-containing protein, partial [Clostridia bacterium]|nr:discoidin domain-containing protein [Clostridia bacterium]
MKKLVCMVLSLFLLAGVAACGEKKKTETVTETVTVNREVETKKYDFGEINYSPSEYEKTYDDTFLTVSVPVKDYFPTGETVSISTKIKANKIWKLASGNIVAGAVYFVVDWGDGTWSYNGPGLQNANLKSNVVHKHVYKKAGTYYVSAAAFNMQTNEFVGWSEGKKIEIRGEGLARKGMIKDVKVISSETYDQTHGAELVTDGNPATYFKSKAADDPYEEQYVGYLFNDNYTLDTLEILFPSEENVFPSNIAVEYTSDYGATWQSLPKYYYLYNYAKGIFNPVMRFPNPKGATLIFALDGIVANGVRVISKLTSVDLDQMAMEKYFCASELRVYGSKRTLFYTSLGNTFDADLNNMWTIYGTARTEPNLTGDQLSSYTNQTPFRTGQALIGSTEWLEWNGLKFNWTDYTEAKDTYYRYLKNTRTGADGWSNDDGYVWATGGGQYHLDMGAHYTYNSIFIIAARNYILQGNNVGEIDSEGEVT